MPSLHARLLNTDWIRQSFFLTEQDVNDQILKAQVFTEASFSFTDTTLGGNFTINNAPQYTRYADIKMGGNTGLVYSYGLKKVIDRRNAIIKQSRQAGNHIGEVAGAGNGGPSSSKGMGRAYKETLDRYSQIITFRFGVPEYNALTTFFGNFYSTGAGTIARTGRAGSMFFGGGGLLYGAGELVGKALALPFFPVILGGRILKFLQDKPQSKYCYLKPTMPLYWKAADLIANGIAVNMKLTPRFLTPEQEKVLDNEENYNSELNRAAYHEMLPDIIDKDGRFNLYAVATRAQRLNAHTTVSVLDHWKRFVGFSEKELDAASDKEKEMLLKGNAMFPALAQPFNEYMKAYNEIPRNAQPTSDADDTASLSIDPEKGTSTRDDMKAEEGSFWKFFNAERMDGSNYVSFHVNNTGTSSESFSNSSTTLEIQNKFNSTSSSARMARINLADGNLGDGAVANVLETVVGGIKDTIAGVASGLQLSGLVAIAGNAFVDIPEQWNEATAQLPTSSFNIELRTPYGNKISRFMNLYVPLALLLAGALPRATGKSSYTAPFMCELHNRGRSMVRFGMIDSLTITRGVGNKGWTAEGSPLGIDVALTVKDLSSIMYMPVTPSFTAGKGIFMKMASAVTGGEGLGMALATSLLSDTWDDDNAYTDYLGILGALSLQDQTYAANKWKLRVTSMINQYKSFGTLPHFMNVVMGTFPGRVINAFSQATDRR